MHITKSEYETNCKNQQALACTHRLTSVFEQLSRAGRLNSPLVVRQQLDFSLELGFLCCRAFCNNHQLALQLLELACKRRVMGRVIGPLPQLPLQSLQL